jgi:hypothetical protein
VFPSYSMRRDCFGRNAAMHDGAKCTLVRGRESSCEGGPFVGSVGGRQATVEREQGRTLPRSVDHDGTEAPVARNTKRITGRGK